MRLIFLIILCLMCGCFKIEETDNITKKSLKYDEKVFQEIPLEYYSLDLGNDDSNITVDGKEMILIDDHFIIDFNKNGEQPSLYYDGIYGDICLENSEYVESIHIEYVAGSNLEMNVLLLWEDDEDRVNYYLHDKDILNFMNFLNENTYTKSDSLKLDELFECGRVVVKFNFSDLYCTQYKMYYDSKLDTYYFIDLIQNQNIYQFDLKSIENFDSRCEDNFC